MKKWKVFIGTILTLGILILPTISFAAEGDTYTNKSKFWDYYEIEEIFENGPVKEADLIKVLQEEGYTDEEIEIMLKEGAERESKVVDRETTEEENTEEEKEETEEENTEEETTTEEKPQGSLTAAILFLAMFIMFFVCYFSI